MSRVKTAYPEPVNVKFPDAGVFRAEVRRRVDEYMKANSLPERGLPAMYRKTAIMFGWWAASYGLLLFGGLGWWIDGVLCVSFGLASAGIGFNVMHDANHEAYAQGARMNRVLGWSIELLGFSSFIWRHEHNVWHHTYTNVSGIDGGLEAQGIMRWSPYDSWKPFHKYQHLYWPVLYALSALSVMTLHNLQVFATGKSGPTFTYPRMSRWERILFVLGRAVNVLIFIAIPLFFFPGVAVLAGFLIAVLSAGLVMATILQLAHVMRTADFPEPDTEPYIITGEWAVHQVEATTDFAAKNRLLTWYIGGLNYQIEHHLFPQVCSVHYARLAPIVRTACEEFGVTYQSQPTLRAALREHVLSLKWLGRSTTLAAMPSRLRRDLGREPVNQLVSSAAGER